MPDDKILVVDDSLLVLNFIEEILKDSYEVRLADSVEKAYVLLEKYPPDLILLDLEMPQKNGYELLKALKDTSGWSDIPVIFLTGTNDRAKEEKALGMGAVDYILKPISVGVLKKRIHMHMELNAYRKKLESSVNLKTRQLLRTQDLILDILANVTTYRDNDTGAHIQRTTEYSKAIVEKLWEIQHPDYIISDIYADDIIKTAKLHDIGKIGIHDDILLKEEKLSPAEFEIIKTHTTLGAQMISHAINNLDGEASFLNTAKEIILYHHEWWDGHGYPCRLKGNETPISARVMAVSDVYDALISSRPYKKAMSHEKAVDIIMAQSGTHFDSALIDIVSDIFPRFDEIAHTFQDE